MEPKSYKFWNITGVTSDIAKHSLSDDDDVINEDFFTTDNQTSIDYVSCLVRFISAKSDEILYRIRLVTQEMLGGKDTKGFDFVIVAIVLKLLEYICIAPTQHRKVLKNLYILWMFKIAKK